MDVINQIGAGLAIALLSGLGGYAISVYRRSQAEHQLLQGLGRDRLQQMYEHYRYTQQGVTKKQRENFIRLYADYHTMGYNGVMTYAYNWVIKAEEIRRDDDDE